MTTDQIEEIVDRTVKATISAVLKEDRIVCKLCGDEEYWKTHETHHQFTAELIATMKRLQNVKWSTLQGIVGALGLAFVLFLIYTFFGIKIP